MNISINQLAKNIAESIANDSTWLPLSAKTPMVFLHGIKGDIDTDGHPVVVVSGSSVNHILGGSDLEYTINVLIAIDVSADYRGNMATSEKDGNSIMVYGDVDFLDDLAGSLINFIDGGSFGAELRDANIEFHTETLPVQFAEITLSFRAIKTY